MQVRACVDRSEVRRLPTTPCAVERVLDPHSRAPVRMLVVWESTAGCQPFPFSWQLARCGLWPGLGFRVRCEGCTNAPSWARAALARASPRYTAWKDLGVRGGWPLRRAHRRGVNSGGSSGVNSGSTWGLHLVVQQRVGLSPPNPANNVLQLELTPPHPSAALIRPAH